MARLPLFLITTAMLALGLHAKQKQIVSYWTESEQGVVTVHFENFPTLTAIDRAFLCGELQYSAQVKARLSQNGKETILIFADKEGVRPKVFTVLARRLRIGFRLMPRPKTANRNTAQGNNPARLSFAKKRS